MALREPGRKGIVDTPIPREIVSPAHIQGKVTVPSPPPSVIARPRLDEVLDDHVDRHRVTLVLATAGAGKTVAAASVARRRPQVAWLTVDRTDRAPRRLLTYLRAALARPLPDLRHAADAAPAAGVADTRATRRLVEAIGDRPLLLVIDGLERLGRAPAAWALIAVVLRHAPATTRVMLLSRRPIPMRLEPAVTGSCGRVGEFELAFTAAEAADAVARLGGRPDGDLAPVLAATGGWVTGVLLEAGRPHRRVAGAGRRSHRLDAYLASEVVAGLPAAERELLVQTALLTEVTADRARALGIDDPESPLVALREMPLPGSWADGGLRLRCHPRFREHLEERLMRELPDRVQELRHAHGALLLAEGDDEGAADALLAAAAAPEALAPARRAILDLVARCDFAKVDRWLRRFDDAGLAATELTTARLLTAIARDDFDRAARLADEAAATTAAGADEPLWPTLIAVTAWAYLHVGRLDDARAALAAADETAAAVAARIGLGLADPATRDHATALPALTGGPLDILIGRVAHVLGRFDELEDRPRSPWHASGLAPWRIASLRVQGHTQHALELYEVAAQAGTPSVALQAYIGPETLIDAGHAEAARRAIDVGRARARASGSFGYAMYNLIADVKLRLRLQGDVRGARSLLQRAELQLQDRQCAHLDLWHGLALLMDGESGTALTRLRRAVRGMGADERRGELATAAVYLAEAEWRAGNEDAADSAADLALATAQRLGSNHLLLQALADFPAVVSRRLDAEAENDSPWHGVGRALGPQVVPRRAGPRRRARLDIQDIGAPSLLLNGTRRRPQLTKCFELLVFLALGAERAATKAALRDALFAGRSDASARAYLRRVTGDARQLLGDRSALVSDDDTVRLADHLTVTTASMRLEARALEAGRLHGQQRHDVLLRVLSGLEAERFLAPLTGAWIEERRARLARLATAARFDAAQTAFALGRLDEALRLSERVLADDPFLESAWRLVMRVAKALDDEAGVADAYARCEGSLATLRATPSTSTRRLLETLRP